MDPGPDLTATAEGRAWARPAVMMPAFALISLVGGALSSFSISANLLVLGVGGVLFWLGMSNVVGRRQEPPRLTARALWWLVPLLFLAGVEVVNFLVGSTYEHPTLSKLADPILKGYLARSAVYFGWLTAFWGLARR